MRKLFSLLLAAALLLGAGATAWSAEEPAPDHCHTISDICIAANGQLIDFTGVSIEFDVTGADAGKAGCLHVDQNGETAAEFGITALDDGLYVLHMQSVNLGHKDFAFDPVVVLDRLLQKGVDSVITALEELDTTAMAQSILDSLTKPEAETPAATEEPAPAPDAGEPAPEMPSEIKIGPPSITIQGDLAGVIAGCGSEPETVHMGGEEYDPNSGEAAMPEGDYQVRTVTYGTETICQILDMIYVDGEPLGLGDALRDAGVEFEMNGVFYDGDAAHFGQITGSISDGEDFSVTAGGEYDQLVTESGNTTAYSFGMTQRIDPEAVTDFSVSFTVSEGEHEGEAFTSASVNKDELTVLTDMAPDQAMEALAEALGLLSGDMLTPVLAPIMMSMTADMDLEGQDTPIG